MTPALKLCAGALRREHPFAVPVPYGHGYGHGYGRGYGHGYGHGKVSRGAG